MPHGAAARLVQPGDLIIIISYALVEEEKIEKFKPKIIYVDANNRIINRKEKKAKSKIRLLVLHIIYIYTIDKNVPAGMILIVKEN